MSLHILFLTCPFIQFVAQLVAYSSLVDVDARCSFSTWTLMLDSFETFVQIANLGAFKPLDEAPASCEQRLAVQHRLRLYFVSLYARSL